MNTSSSANGTTVHLPSNGSLIDDLLAAANSTVPTTTAHAVPVESGLNYFSVINIIICAPLLALQLTSLPIFLIYPNYRRNVCFRILFANGIADSLQLGPNLIFAILNLITSNIPIWFQSIGAATVMNAWNLLVMQHFLLAMNRLIVIMRARFLGSKFIPNEDTEAIIFNIAHVFCWGVFFTMFGLQQTDLMGNLFHSGTSTFYYDIRKPYTQTWRDVFKWVTIVIPIICLAIYIAIILTAKFSRARMQRGDDKTRSASAPLLNDYEKRLLIQSFILYAIMAFMIIAWNSFTACPNEICIGKILGIIPVSLARTHHTVLIEGVWMIYCGLNPILFLTMNKEFRNRFLMLYGIKLQAAQPPATGITSLSSATGNQNKANAKLGMDA